MKHYKFFENRECEYYPCHKSNKINCLFCMCPLYNSECGGNFKILANGVRDCSDCLIPHSENGYDYIINKLKENNKGGNMKAEEIKIISEQDKSGKTYWTASSNDSSFVIGGGDSPKEALNDFLQNKKIYNAYLKDNEKKNKSKKEKNK